MSHLNGIGVAAAVFVCVALAIWIQSLIAKRARGEA